MARKTMDVLIDADNRDKGKLFFVEEMPASQAEEWATRALMAMMRSGIDIPENIQDAGLAGIRRHRGRGARVAAIEFLRSGSAVL